MKYNHTSLKTENGFLRPGKTKFLALFNSRYNDYNEYTESQQHSDANQ
jgi:uncharacterized protein YaaQ